MKLACDQFMAGVTQLACPRSSSEDTARDFQSRPRNTQKNGSQTDGKKGNASKRSDVLEVISGNTQDEGEAPVTEGADHTHQRMAEVAMQRQDDSLIEAVCCKHRCWSSCWAR